MWKGVFVILQFIMHKSISKKYLICIPFPYLLHNVTLLLILDGNDKNKDHKVNKVNFSPGAGGYFHSIVKIMEFLWIFW